MRIEGLPHLPLFFPIFTLSSLLSSYHQPLRRIEPQCSPLKKTGFFPISCWIYSIHRMSAGCMFQNHGQFQHNHGQFNGPQQNPSQFSGP